MDKKNCTPDDIQEIFEVAKSLSSMLDVDVLLKRIDAAAEKLLDSEASAIMLLDEDRENLLFKVASGEKGGIVQRMKVKVGQGIAGTVALEKKPLTVNDVAHDQRFTGSMDKSSGFVTRSILCVPMFIEAELLGVMEVLNKRNGAEYTADDLHILESLAALAAVSINNARTAEDQRNFFVNIIEVLISAIESRDSRLVGHAWRVAQLSTTLARRLGIEGAAYKSIYYGALLHDIGLINIKAVLTVQQGVITIHDRDPEVTHPRLGAELIRNINLLKGAVSIVLHHHEYYDGTGFPDKLTGDKIPLGARIVGLAESVDEMRIGGIPEDRVAQMLVLGKETRYDPQVVEAYLQEFAPAALNQQ